VSPEPVALEDEHNVVGEQLYVDLAEAPGA
jgi:hypothetical protein